MNADVQRLESERLRPVTDLDPVDELFRQLIGLLAELCRDAGMMSAIPPGTCAPTWWTYKKHLRNGEHCERCLAWVAAQIRASRARKAAAP